jgi:hypothetical protein
MEIARNRIKSLSGDQNIVFGNNLHSGMDILVLTLQYADHFSLETSTINSHKLSHEDVNYALVDTPGFDDSYRSNQEVVEQVLEWLAEKRRKGVEFAGIIYVHSIMNPRMQGTAMQNLRMFRKLVGANNMSKVVATSFWDQVDPPQGYERERALIQSPKFFATMIQKGPPTCA